MDQLKDKAKSAVQIRTNLTNWEEEMKKIILLLLVLTLSLSLFAACKTDTANDEATDVVEATEETTTKEATSEETATEEPAKEISSEYVEWSLLMKEFGNAPTTQDQMFWQKIEEIWNVKLALEVAPATDFDTRVNLALASDEVPNLIYGANLSQYYSTGIVWDLKPYLETYAPNAYAMMTAQDDIWKNCQTDDGGVFYLPSLYGNEYGATYLFINHQVLKQVGLDVPTTTDEYYNALKVMQEANPDMYVTAGASQVGWTNANKGYYYAFGTWPDWVHFEVGEYVYGPYERKDEMKACLTWLNMMYEEGIFDPEYMTIDNATGTAKIANGEALAVFGWGGSAVFETDEDGIYLKKDAYDALVAADEQKFDVISALIGPEGYQYSQFVGGMNGALSIMSSLEDIERALTVFDYWYTDEGIELCNWGIEGETFTRNADGSKDFIPTVVKNLNDGLRSNGFCQANMLWVVDSVAKNYYAAIPYYEAVLKAASHNLVQNPSLTMTDDETEVYNQVGADLKTVIAEMIPKFITGELNLEGDYDDYIATLEDIGVQEYMDAVHSAYDRWMNR